MKLHVPRLLDLATVSSRAATACFDAAVNGHLRKAPAGDRPRPARTPAPEGLGPVFAAHILDEPTPIAHATAFRAPGHDVTYFSGGHRSPRSRSWFALTLDPPAHPAAATWDLVEPSGDPGGGISHFIGHADPSVIAVMMRTPDGAEHFAPAAGGLWWTAAWLDAEGERTAEHATWRAVAADGEVLATGRGLGGRADGREPGRPTATSTGDLGGAVPGAPGGAETDPETEPAELPVLRELQAREPLLHRPATNVDDIAQHLAAEFSAVGPSGRRYSRQDVVDVLSRRHVEADERRWEATAFHCLALGGDNYLLTYELRRGRRQTRRTTLWRRTPQGWEAVHHQGTPAS